MELLFAIDFDETYSADPIFFDRFLRMIDQHGHSAICVTMRFEAEDGEEIRRLLEGKVEAIIFTGRKAKHQYVQERGYYPSIWIDDSPHFIFQDSR